MLLNLKKFISTNPAIIQEPDERLRVKSQPFSLDQPDLPLLKAYMYMTMKNASGIGLAAPQIGLNYRAIIVSIPQKESSIRLNRFMVNPVIEERMGVCSIEEACLSVPNKSVEIRRNETITVSYLDENLKPQTESFSQLNAICIQHEIDHLEGILISDYI